MTVGSLSAPLQGSWAAAEGPVNVVDNNVATKHYNFLSTASATSGVNTGFYVTPQAGNSVATGIQFATANDCPVRDPIMMTLEGTDVPSAQLLLGASWTLIYAGSTGISTTVTPNRMTYIPMQNFTNTVAYNSYRLLITVQDGIGGGVQYSEANIFGWV
jgi:hypothetical protein